MKADVIIEYPVKSLDKIFSYIIASFIVILLFAFSTSIIPNDDIKLLNS